MRGQDKKGQPGPQQMFSHPVWSEQQPQLPLWRWGKEEELSKTDNTAVSVVHFSSPQRPRCFIFAAPLSYFPSHASVLKHLLAWGTPQEVCRPDCQLPPPLHTQDGFVNHFTGTRSVMGYLHSPF